MAPQSLQMLRMVFSTSNIQGGKPVLSPFLHMVEEAVLIGSLQGLRLLVSVTGGPAPSPPGGISPSPSLSHTHRKPPPGLTPPPTQSPTGGSALFAEKAFCVSVTSTHCSGVRVKPGTYRDKGLGAPPSQGPVSPGSGIHGEEQARD